MWDHCGSHWDHWGTKDKDLGSAQKQGWAKIKSWFDLIWIYLIWCNFGALWFDLTHMFWPHDLIWFDAFSKSCVANALCKRVSERWRLFFASHFNWSSLFEESKLQRIRHRKLDDREWMGLHFCKSEDHPGIYFSRFELFFDQRLASDAQIWSILHCTSISDLQCVFGLQMSQEQFLINFPGRKFDDHFGTKKGDDAAQISLQKTQNDDQICVKIDEIKLTT